jgi:hypothetical protein
MDGRGHGSILCCGAGGFEPAVLGARGLTPLLYYHSTAGAISCSPVSALVISSPAGIVTALDCNLDHEALLLTINDVPLDDTFAEAFPMPPSPP